MARLPRLAIADEVHLVVLRGHNQQPVFLDDVDRVRFLAALRGAQVREQIAIHAFVLLPDRVWLLLTPAAAAALGRMMQVVGRQHTVAFNRRHARSGTLWAGRFQSTVVERGRHELEALLFIEQAPLREGLVSKAEAFAWSSVRHHLGVGSNPMLSDTPTYWSLGNTPFDRTAAYARLLDEALPSGVVDVISDAAQKGWALASSTSHLEQLQQRTERPLLPRPRGRPSSRQ